MRIKFLAALHTFSECSCENISVDIQHREKIEEKFYSFFRTIFQSISFPKKKTIFQNISVLKIIKIELNIIMGTTKISFCIELFDKEQENVTKQENIFLQK